jgi:hypothetical protein
MISISCWRCSEVNFLTNFVGVFIARTVYRKSPRNLYLAAYAAKKTLKFVHRQKWQFTCGLKSNRKLNGVRLDEQNRKETHKWHTKISVTNAKKEERSYFIRQLEGRLEDAETLLTGAVGMALDGATLDQVLRRFLGRSPADA